MDASTSREQKELTTGTPDSRKIEVDLVNFLLHGKPLAKTNIPNKVWIEVIARFLWQVDSHFKYIDGLKTIEQIITDGEWLNSHGAIEITNAGATFSPPKEFNRKTRGFFFFTLRHSPYGKGGAPVSYTNLVLTEKRQWIRWDVVRIGSSCASDFSLLSDEELCSLLDETEHSGYNIMDKLYLILYSSRNRKEERLASIKKLEDEAQRICDRSR